MGIWIGIVIMGIFTFLSMYMALLALRTGESSAYFFAAAGLFCGIFFVISLIKVFAKKTAWGKKIDETMAGGPGPITFVPHWFLMAAITIAGIAILAAIFIPKFFR